jgi:hypothetical protein
MQVTLELLMHRNLDVKPAKTVVAWACQDGRKRQKAAPGFGPVPGPALRILNVYAAFLPFLPFFDCCRRRDNKTLALFNSARRSAVSPRPARFMKYNNILNPDPTPLGETFLEASDRAIVFALFVKSPAGGKVETVVTF